MIQISDQKTLLSFQNQDRQYFAGSSFCQTENGSFYCYVEVMDNCERLMLQSGENMPEEIYRAEYISAPLAAEHGVLFAARKDQQVWEVYAAQLQNGRIQVNALGNGSGKRDFFSASADRDYVVYEKREGVHTRIALVRYQNGCWEKEKELTDGSLNCYDPVIAFSKDRLYLAYTAFVRGNYRIFLQELDLSGKPLGPALQVSDQKASCFWPSVCAREEGGIWICWSSFTRLQEFDTPYVQHYKHIARSSLFVNHTEIYAAVYENGSLYCNRQNAGACMTNEALLVDHAETSKHPQIFEKDGEVYILLRHYGGEAINLAVPDVSITTLTPEGWSEPQILLPRGLHEERPDFQLTERGLFLLSGADHRQSWWCMRGEYFDQKNTIDLILQDIILDRKPESRRIRTLVRYYIKYADAPSMVDDCYTREQDGIYQLIWGQTHTHSNLSICQRLVDQTLDFNFRFYQDVQGSLFGAVSDHGYNMWKTEIHRNHKKADYYYFPGEFIALPCYEWTGSGGTEGWGGPYGHLNPVYCEESGTLPVHVAVDPEDPGHTPQGLWKEYRGKKIVTIPHHTADLVHPYTWDNYDSRFVPIVEIFQDCRGQCEQPDVLGTTPYPKTEKPGCWVIDGLRRGYHLGFIGGGDHAGIGRGGALVTELTRSGLYDAFMNHRTFASTGAGADICFTANGKPAGSIIRAEQADFSFRIHTGDEIRVVQLVKNGDTIRQFGNSGRNFAFSFTAEKEEQENFYYFRVGTENGEVFWTSPIWI